MSLLMLNLFYAYLYVKASSSKVYISNCLSFLHSPPSCSPSTPPNKPTPVRRPPLSHYTHLFTVSRLIKVLLVALHLDKLLEPNGPPGQDGHRIAPPRPIGPGRPYLPCHDPNPNMPSSILLLPQLPLLALSILMSHNPALPGSTSYNSALFLDDSKPLTASR